MKTAQLASLVQEGGGGEGWGGCSAAGRRSVVSSRRGGGMTRWRLAREGAARSTRTQESRGRGRGGAAEDALAGRRYVVARLRRVVHVRRNREGGVRGRGGGCCSRDGDAWRRREAGRARTTTWRRDRVAGRRSVVPPRNRASSSCSRYTGAGVAVAAQTTRAQESRRRGWRRNRRGRSAAGRRYVVSGRRGGGNREGGEGAAAEDAARGTAIYGIDARLGANEDEDAAEDVARGTMFCRVAAKSRAVAQGIHGRRCRDGGESAAQRRTPLAGRRDVASKPRRVLHGRRNRSDRAAAGPRTTMQRRPCGRRCRGTRSRDGDTLRRRKIAPRRRRAADTRAQGSGTQLPRAECLAHDDAAELPRRGTAICRVDAKS